MRITHKGKSRVTMRVRVGDNVWTERGGPFARAQIAKRRCTFMDGHCLEYGRKGSRDR